MSTAVAFGTSANVILANGTDAHTVDALTAGYLAGKKSAPIMLTQAAVTPPQILKQIAASGAKDVWLVGGDLVISPTQEAALKALYTVHRLPGANRYETAKAVIAEGGTATTALLASGVVFPDALAAGALSYKAGMPIAITAPTTVPAPTMAALKAAGVTKVLTVGGTLRVAKTVLDELAAEGITAFAGAGVTDGRIAGGDRSQTSTLLADYMIAQQGFTNTKINVASGDPSKFGADALGGAALSGKDNTPTLITATTKFAGKAPGILAFLTAHAATLTSGHIFGGPLAVTDALKADMEKAAGAVTTSQTFTVTPATTTSVLTTKTVTYTASGFAAGDLLTIKLVDPALIDGSFRLDTTNRVAVLTAPLGVAADIKVTQINGIDVASPGASVIFTANGPSITFTVATTATGVGSVVPVVFKRSVAGDTTLNVNLAGVATEASGIGGTATFTTAPAVVPAENADATSFSSNVRAINGTTSFTTNSTTNTGSLMTLGTDTYKLGTVTIDKAKFYSLLSGASATVTGDTVTVVYVNGATASSPSTFTIMNDVFPVTGFSGVLTAPSAVDNVVTVKYTHPVSTTVGGTTFDLQRAPVVITGATETVGTYASVKTGLVADYNQTTFTETVANGNYKYRMVYTAPEFSGTAKATGAATATVVVPPTASTAIPELLRTYTPVNTSNVGNLSKGDQIQIVFDRAITTPVVGAKVGFGDATQEFTYTAADSTDPGSATFSVNTSAVTIDGASIGAGRVLTLTVLANTTGTVAFPATIAGFIGVGNAFGVALIPTGTGTVNA